MFYWFHWFHWLCKLYLFCLFNWLYFLICLIGLIGFFSSIGLLGFLALLVYRFCWFCWFYWSQWFYWVMFLMVSKLYRFVRDPYAIFYLKYKMSDHVFQMSSSFLQSSLLFDKTGNRIISMCLCSELLPVALVSLGLTFNEDLKDICRGSLCHKYQVRPLLFCLVNWFYWF